MLVLWKLEAGELAETDSSKIIRSEDFWIFFDARLVTRETVIGRLQNTLTVGTSALYVPLIQYVRRLVPLCLIRLI